MKKTLLFCFVMVFALVSSALGDRPGFSNGEMTALKGTISASADSAQFIIESDGTTKEWIHSVNVDGYSIKDNTSGTVPFFIQNGAPDSSLGIYANGTVEVTIAIDSTDVTNGSISGSDLTDPFWYTGSFISVTNDIYTNTITATGNIAGATYGSDSSVSDAELLFINSLSSNAQTQITAKAAKGANSDITALSGITGTITNYELKTNNTGLTDGEFRAVKSANGVLNQNVTAGAVVYFSKASGSHYLTDADNTNSSVGVALSTESGNAGDTITLMYEGWYRNDSLFEWGLTEATDGNLWMSDDTAGGITDDLGTLVEEDDMRMKLGHPVTSDIIYFKPSDSYNTYNVP